MPNFDQADQTGVLCESLKWWNLVAIMESRNRCGPALLELTGYCSVTQSCPILCSPMDCSMPGFPVFTVSWSLLKLMSIESVMPSNHLILCRPLILPSILPSIRVFSNESVLHIRWPKYWSFSFSINPSNNIQD